MVFPTEGREKTHEDASETRKDESISASIKEG